MATPTTSLAGIRDALVSVVTGLTPNVSTAISHAGVGFTFAPSRVEYADFRLWAEESPTVAFRFYDISPQGWEVVGTSDQDLQRRLATFELVMAYPRTFGLYGDDNTGDLWDALEGDLSQIMAAVGLHGAANYPSGACPVSELVVAAESGDVTTFGVMQFEVEYYYDTVP